MARPDRTEQITVLDSEGMTGTFEAQALRQAEAAIWITFDSGRRVQVPVDMLHRRDNRAYFLPLSLRELDEGRVGFQQTADETTDEHDGSIVTVLPIVKEEVQVSTRQVETGSVRIQKRVQTREQLVTVPLVRDQVQVERMPIDRYLERPVEVHYQGDTLVIPVMEEAVIVQKRLLLREEIRITTVRERVQYQETVPLQHEDVTVTREQAELERADADERTRKNEA